MVKEVKKVIDGKEVHKDNEGNKGKSENKWRAERHAVGSNLTDLSKQSQSVQDVANAAKRILSGKELTKEGNLYYPVNESSGELELSSPHYIPESPTTSETGLSPESSSKEKREIEEIGQVSRKKPKTDGSLSNRVREFDPPETHYSSEEESQAGSSSQTIDTCKMTLDEAAETEKQERTSYTCVTKTQYRSAIDRLGKTISRKEAGRGTNTDPLEDLIAGKTAIRELQLGIIKGTKEAYDALVFIRDNNAFEPIQDAAKKLICLMNPSGDAKTE